MKVADHALTFGCGEETLVGVLSLPERAASIGVVVVVGGPQYRAGSHRQFVLLARTLSKAGYPVLRFDYRGMGDSSGAQRNFEAVSEDIGAAIETLQHRAPEIKHVVLWGLCDGASAALMYCRETADPRVLGLCLLNPWVRSETSLARTHLRHYYSQRLAQRDFWVKLMSGKVSAGAVPGLIKTLRASIAREPQRRPDAPFPQRMAEAWKRFKGPILLTLSGNDYTAKEFIEHASSDAAWEGVLSNRDLETRELPSADHTFSQRREREKMEAFTLAWIGTLAALSRNESLLEREAGVTR